MKHARFEYDGRVLFDGDVAELEWKDSDTTVSVVVKLKKPASAAGGVLDMLTASRRQHTEQQVEAKRKELKGELL